ncbi:MAG: spore cortex-lytic enzyme [Clostridiales bacterium]|nr:spore cortex-lytic enzyme [Clostridiales bacterium]
MKKIVFVFLILSTYLLIGVNLVQSNVYEQVYSYYGSTGNEVIQIQTRLKNWGYYTGAIDGVYGYETYRAVRQFQSKNGLAVDGVAGNATLSALGISTSSGPSNSNVDLLARAISGEARGEPYEGQVAVGAVILNRVDNPNFPNTIAGVVYQKGAFDSVADGQINMTPTSSARKAAQDAINGWDPSGGCIYFYNPATSTSKWIWSRPIVKTIGKHNFAK